MNEPLFSQQIMGNRSSGTIHESTADLGELGTVNRRCLCPNH